MKRHFLLALTAGLLPILLAAACVPPPASVTSGGDDGAATGPAPATATDRPSPAPTTAPSEAPSATPVPSAVPSDTPPPTTTAVPPIPTDPAPPSDPPATATPAGTALADTALPPGPPPTASPSPEPTVTPRPPSNPNAPDVTYVVYSEQALGEYVARVWVTSDYPFPNMLSLGTIDRGAERLVQISEVAGFEPLPATDLTGEGEHDVAFALRWGGSHCCQGTVLYNLGAAPQQVLWVGGEIGTGKFRDLDGDGDWEFITRDVTSGLPCSRPSAMAVLAYSPERGYAPASPEYPAVFEPEIVDLTARAEQRLVENGAILQCDVSDLMLDYLYSGQAERGWAEFERLYTAPDAADFRAALEAAAAKGQMYVAATP